MIKSKKNQNNIDYFLKIDYHWNNIKIWWDNISKDTNNLFPNNFKKVSENDKNVFNIKLLYLIKKIFNIDDINIIDKININNYNIDDIIKNIKDNYNLLNIFVEDYSDLKNNINYILQYQNYFGLIKKKLIDIALPLFNDEHFDKLFKTDDDLTRILAPIAGSVFYIYLTERDVEKTLQICLTLDNIFIQFFVISYLIVDNFMDTVNDDNLSKKIFLKWFMNIVENPSDKIFLSDEHQKIWQCITFEKYFSLFIQKYPYSENKIIYDFVKIMISTLNKANIMQKNKDISENDILEHTFKKSYVVSFFMALLINIQLKKKISKKNMFNLCKLLFLIQIYDDYFDVDKDILEGNYTYFNSDKININFDDRVKKTVLANFLFIKELNEKNNNVNNIINYVMKNVILLVFYIHMNKISNSLINYFFEYSIFSDNSIKYFDKNSYDQFNNNILIKFIKLYIS